jgi:hypothetical protein
MLQVALFKEFSLCVRKVVDWLKDMPLGNHLLWGDEAGTIPVLHVSSVVRVPVHVGNVCLLFGSIFLLLYPQLALLSLLIFPHRGLQNSL